MEKTTPISVPADENSIYVEEIDRHILAMQEMQRKMSEDKEEILALQNETRALLDELMTTLKVA